MVAKLIFNFHSMKRSVQSIRSEHCSSFYWESLTIEKHIIDLFLTYLKELALLLIKRNTLGSFITTVHTLKTVNSLKTFQLF